MVRFLLALLLVTALGVSGLGAAGCARDPGAGPASASVRPPPAALGPAAAKHAALEHGAERLEREGRWTEAAALWREEALRGGRAAAEPARRAMAASLMAGRLEEAERLASQLLERDPAWHEVLFYLGDSQRVLLRYDAARATLEKLLALEPDHLRGALALGHVLARLGEPERALPLFRRFLAWPGAPPLLREQAELDLARALRRLSRHREAAEALASLLERSPHHPVALSEAAQTFFLLGRTELSRGLRERFAWLSARGHQLSTEDETKLYSVESNPRAAAARRALQAADRREFLPAIAGLEALLEAEPGDPLYAAALARLLFRLERHAGGLRVLEKALAAGKEPSAELQALRAEAELALGRREAAREALRAASRLFGEPQGQEGQAPVAPSMEPEKALAIHLEAAFLEMSPGGDRVRAEEALDRAGRAVPGSPLPVLVRARLALQAGALEDAGRLLEKAQAVVEAAPGTAPVDHPGLRRLRAVHRGLSGDLRAAAREIMDLIRANPGDLESFEAFEQVFGAKASDPQVARVLAMKRDLEKRRADREARRRAMGLLPLEECGKECLELGAAALEAGRSQEGLDLLFLAAELLPADTAALLRAEAALVAPGDSFLRIHLLYRVLGRASDDPEALRRLVGLYLELDLRLEEAEALAVRLAAREPGEASQNLLFMVRQRRAAAAER